MNPLKPTIEKPCPLLLPDLVPSKNGRGIAFKTKALKVNSNLTLIFPSDPQHINPMEEKQYFCLECLGYDFYISSVTLKDGFEAWLHMCTKCNIRMEYCGSP